MRRLGRLAGVAVAGALAIGALTGAAAVPPAVIAPEVPVAPEAPVVPVIPDNPEDPVRKTQYWLDAYGIREAWKTTRGAGVRIAVIDTGIAKGPIEFEGAVVGGTDVSDLGSDDGRTPIGAVDRNHGSWVASLAAARGTGAGGGMIGVAPEAELLSISVGFGASAPVSFTEQIAKAMVWAVDHGADVINLSLTTNTLDWDESWDDAFLYAFEHDVVVIVAAGNRGSGTTVVGAPATIPGVLPVAGVDPTGKASVEASTQGVVLGVAAPSENLLGVSADGRVVTWNGTSGAAPIVAGIAALVRAAHPDLDAANVINRLIKTARPAPGATTTPDPLLYGNGLVDAAAAVAASVPTVRENPMGSLAEWIRIYRRAVSQPEPEASAAPVEVPALPPAGGPTEAGSPLLPSAETLRYGTVPLLAVTVPAILIGLGVTAAARRIRLARAPRSPSKNPLKE